MSEGPVVVTGAGGFVGSALVDALAAAGRPHVALARQAPAAGAKARPVTVLDLATAPDATLDATLAGAVAVVHLAGRAHVIDDRATDAAALYRAANVVATQHLAAAAVRAGVRRFVFASTIKVHGEATVPGRPFRSDDPLLPHDDYARSKAEGERALASIAAGTGLDAVVLRLPLVYGPRVKGNFLTLIDAVARRARLPFGRIANRRDFLYVGNLVQAIETLLDAPGAAGGAWPGAVDGAWLVADGEAVSTAELARRLAAAVGVAPRVIDVPAPVVSLAAWATGRGALLRRAVSSLEVDASPLAARFGPPPFTLDQGLAATAAWWRMRHAI